MIWEIRSIWKQLVFKDMRQFGKEALLHKNMLLFEILLLDKTLVLLWTWKSSSETGWQWNHGLDLSELSYIEFLATQPHGQQFVVPKMQLKREETQPKYGLVLHCYFPGMPSCWSSGQLGKTLSQESLIQFYKLGNRCEEVGTGCLLPPMIGQHVTITGLSG